MFVLATKILIGIWIVYVLKVLFNKLKFDIHIVSK